MIYFARSGKDGPIKIGYTKNFNSLKLRIKELQCGNPEELEVMAVFEGGREAEASLSHVFKKYWIRGEWYKPSPEILAFLEENKHENHYAGRISPRAYEVGS